MEYFGNLGETLKKYREMCKWTQEEVAEKLGVTPRTIARWESNKREPRFKNLCMLAKCYNMELYDIISNVDTSIYETDFFCPPHLITSASSEEAPYDKKIKHLKEETKGYKSVSDQCPLAAEKRPSSCSQFELSGVCPYFTSEEED